MKLKKITSILVLAVALAAGPALSEETPEALVNSVAEATDMEQVPELTPEQNWENFLIEKGWNSGFSAGGVIDIEGQGLIISSAMAFTKVQLGQPGWIESRLVAFESAEMEAKMKIIRHLSESIETQRSLSLMEAAVWEDGQVNKIEELNEVAETLKRIGKKSMALAEGQLDSALQKLDPHYDPAKYAGKSVEDLTVIARDMFQRQFKSVAMGTLIGAMPLYSSEGKDASNAYKVLVGVIWSPKLNRLAMNLFNDTYTIPPVAPKEPLAEQIPQDKDTLLGTFGTRVVIDDKGQYAVLAYGQAQPRTTSPARQSAALHQAKQIASNRARGMLVNFIREGMTLSDGEASRELLQEFSDTTFGTETVRDYQKKITGKKIKVKLSGLRVLKEWEYAHPDTGQSVAGAVVAWSPSYAEMSRQAAETMQGRPAAKKTTAAANTEQEQEKTSLKSMKVDTSAY